jgi:hypothetical protein
MGLLLSEEVTGSFIKGDISARVYFNEKEKMVP